MRTILTDLRGNPIYSFAQRRLRRIRGTTDSGLFFMIQNRSWETVLARCKSHPNEAALQDESTGNTPLHVACRLDPPPEVVRALSATSRIKNNEGATPLHIAASHRCSAEALGVLIEVAAESSVEEEDDVKDSASPTADLSRMGRAPIHYACMSFRGLEIDAFRLLLDATLKNGNIKVSKRVELEDYIDEEFEEELDDDDVCLEPTPAELPREEEVVNVMSLKDATGQTPLGLLFRRYRERVRHVISTVDRVRREHEQTPDRATLAAALTVHADLGELWEKARWIVARLTEERLQREGPWGDQGYCSPGEASQEAAGWAAEKYQPSSNSTRIENIFSLDASNGSHDRHQTVEEGRPLRIVHASVALTGYGCPPEMIRLAVSLHPNQVSEMDEDGNLPLHLAVTAASHLATADFASPSAMAAAVDAADDMSVLSDALSFFSSATISQTTNPFDKVIKILLHQYPEAARIPQGRTGRLPLVLAIESGRRTWEDGLRSLLCSYPPAMHNKKLIEPYLYPYLLSLLASGESGGPCDLTGSLLDDLFMGSRHGRRLSKSTRLRQEANIRTALFDLLRTKPEWLTKEARILY